jgi:phytoene/squalene synthetase
MNSDLGWCREVLPAVSRTFALGIRSLPDPFEPWITVGYLLCRVVDTVEDTPGLDWADRRRIFERFDHALHTGDADSFTALGGAFPDTADGDLARQLDRVLAPLQTFPEPVQAATRKWVGEMATGMATYARRHDTSTGRTTLEDAADLRRYCWYVAGTVGHLLTDVFTFGDADIRRAESQLRPHATGFGMLLQITNIVKDVTDDWDRGWCFIPASIQAAHGVPDGRLLDADQSTSAQAAVDAVNRLARSHFSDAIAYVLAVPTSGADYRRFCLLPMLLAARTLQLALGNSAVIATDRPVKVDRATVAATTEQVERLLQDNTAIAHLSLSATA